MATARDIYSYMCISIPCNETRLAVYYFCVRHMQVNRFINEIYNVCADHLTFWDGNVEFIRVCIMYLPICIQKYFKLICSVMVLIKQMMKKKTNKINKSKTTKTTTEAVAIQQQPFVITKNKSSSIKLSLA